MIISHKHKFIFVHIPKCVGTSITRSIIPFLGDKDIYIGCTLEGEKLEESGGWKGLDKHATALRIRQVLGEEIWNDYFKFSFIRNPWDILVSRYHWHLRTAWDDKRKSTKNIKKMKDFNEYVQSSYVWKNPCFDYISDREGNIIVDFIGRYENIRADFLAICDKVGLPSINLEWSNKTNHYSYDKYYTEKTKKLIAKMYYKDIKVFSYKFK